MRVKERQYLTVKEKKKKKIKVAQEHHSILKGR